MSNLGVEIYVLLRREFPATAHKASQHGSHEVGHDDPLGTACSLATVRLAKTVVVTQLLSKACGKTQPWETSFDHF